MPRVIVSNYTDVIVNIYDVKIIDTDIDFSATVDEDGDIRIELKEGSFEEAAIEFLKNKFEGDEIRDIFEIELGGH